MIISTKNLLFAFCFSAALTTLQAQSKPDKIYVCTPCGYDCDLVEHEGPGICSTCNMEIVDKATVHFEDISFAQACKRVMSNKNAVLLDVRSAGEFSGGDTSRDTFGHLKNAMNINVTELSSRLDELKDFKTREIIVYCSQSHRSPAAAYLLTNSGFTNVVNVSGGVSILETQFGNDTCLSELFVKH